MTPPETGQFSPKLSPLCAASHCVDCGRCGSDQELLIVAADFGEGAFLAVLCSVCEHRRWYRAELRKRARLRHQSL